jgi:gamma-glutamylcyclotransferase (GGCT)/AIG2-like uncharacterized protein YtfP
MTKLLFVYGTLMAGAADAPLGAEQRARLSRESLSLGPASLAGRLVDFGSYPGLIDAAIPADRVHGEVVALADPAASFAWLDPYEMIEPGRADNEYERVVRPVHLADGREVEVSVYLYRADVSRGRIVEDGRWIGRKLGIG